MSTEKFDGEKRLRTIGAVWFVSYAYYEKVDKSFKNWENVSDSGRVTRISGYNNSRQYHKLWLIEVLCMSKADLNKNELSISADRVKEMAKELLLNHYLRGYEK